jgi:serine/threonine kinase 16
LHDIIYKKQADMNDLTASAFTEVQLLRIFRGICYAVQGMHQYRLPQVPTTREGESAHMHRNPYYASRSSKDDPSRSLLRPGGNGGEEEEETYAESEVSDDNIVAYAHRDIKPGNVLIGDDGATPILTDFGSMSRAKIDIRTRQQAAMEQDRAAEQCSMAYRAPELFDIRPGTTLSEKVDIWSLGCLLYAMAYGMSPFETNLQHGGSIALAVQNGRYTFPAQNSRYSEGLKDIIKAMLVVDPNDRPDISQIIGAVETLLQKISNMHS